MAQRWRTAALPKTLLEPLELARRKTQRGRPLPVADPASQRRRH
jgi:hypothetical protein